MTKLTKLDAINKSIVLWEEIQRLGNDPKEVNFTTRVDQLKIRAYRNLKLEDDILNCPCCTYASENSTSRGDNFCDACPMDGNWQLGESDDCVQCLYSGSPFKSLTYNLKNQKAYKDMLTVLNAQKVRLLFEE